MLGTGFPLFAGAAYRNLGVGWTSTLHAPHLRVMAFNERVMMHDVLPIRFASTLDVSLTLQVFNINILYLQLFCTGTHSLTQLTQPSNRRPRWTLGLPTSIPLITN